MPIPSVPELGGADSTRPDACYVGHLLGDIRQDAARAFQPEPGRRYVYVYLGTGALPQPALRAMLPQVFAPDGPHTVLVGAQSVSQAGRLGAVEFRPYVPVDAVLTGCGWVICHSGQTISQALRRAVPLIIFPGPIFERRFNAEKV
jgi:UDP:flavonoid glycosyltransferase YjiC (YdhE family)